MSAFDVDIPDDSFEAPAEAPVVEAPAPEAPAAVETPAASAAAPTAETTPDTFDRKYVEELRQESAGYRTKAKPFVEAFDGIDESDRDVFLGLAQLYKTDPVGAAREMARLAQGLMGDDHAEAPAAPARTEQLAPYMTRADYDAIRNQERLETATRQIEAEAKGLGYDVAAPEYKYLLAVAQTNGGNIAAAHAHIESQQQAAVAKYVASKEADAAAAPTAPHDTGAPASGERQLKTWRDVEAAIDEMF